MTPVVLKCGETPVPLALTSVTAVSAPALPDKDDFEDAFAHLEAVEDPRLIVVGGDAAFAATLTRLMRTDRLSVELAYVPEKRTPATEAYGLRTGSKAAAEALRSEARSIPLIRDDAGIALVGRASWRVTVPISSGGGVRRRHTAVLRHCPPRSAHRTDSDTARIAGGRRPSALVRRVPLDQAAPCNSAHRVRC